MKNKSIKEQLSIGSDPSSYIMSKTPKPSFITNGGFHSNADSVIAQRMAMVNEDDEELDSEEDTMPEDILEFRVYKNNNYQLLETLENVNEGLVQKAADFAKAIPGLDTVVGNIELYLQAGNAKSTFDGLSDIVGSLKHTGGMNALGIVGTEQQYNNLLSKFVSADANDKSILQQGVAKILEVIKQMTITAVQTFDSIVALPSFAGTPVAGAIGETIANVITSLGTFLRDQPVEKFVFKTISKRSGIVAKIVNLFESVLATITSGGPIGKALQYVVEKITKTGGEIVKLFIEKPFELLRRLGDLYKASVGEFNNTMIPHQGVSTTSNDQLVYAKNIETDQIQIAENQTKHSILFLLESVEKDEEEDDEESFKEIDLEEFSGAGAVGGYALPLGASNKSASKQKDHHKLLEKQVNEQIERMRILEVYHQKTTNKLK